MEPKEWQRAGIVDLEGRLGRPVPTGAILVPGSVSAEADGIRWEYSEASYFTEPDRALLNRFVRLAAAPAEEIAMFASQWGVLALDNRKIPCNEGMSSGCDSVDAWHYYAQRATAVLNLIAAIKLGKIGAVDDWRILGPVASTREEIVRCTQASREYPMPQSLLPVATLRQAGNRIEGELAAWMGVWRKNRLDPPSDFKIDFDGQRSWTFQIDFKGYLFPAIAFQLCLVAINADSLYCCSACGYLYIRPKTERRPKPGQANYCGACRKLKIPNRRASERYRQKDVNND